MRPIAGSNSRVKVQSGRAQNLFSGPVLILTNDVLAAIGWMGKNASAISGRAFVHVLASEPVQLDAVFASDRVGARLHAIAVIRLAYVQIPTLETVHVLSGFARTIKRSRHIGAIVLTSTSVVGALVDIVVVVVINQRTHESGDRESEEKSSSAEEVGEEGREREERERDASGDAAGGGSGGGRLLIRGCGGGGGGGPGSGKSLNDGKLAARKTAASYGFSHKSVTDKVVG